MFDQFSHTGVVPVVVVDRPEHAVPLADALAAGGISIVEVTFRTSAAAQVIRTIREERPKMLVGAGTLITADNVRAAIDAGAHFGVAPGVNPRIIEMCGEEGFPFVPGVMTPSDIERALEGGGKLLKYFPCEAAGGLEFLSAIAGPFKHLGVKFMPTGGITPENLEKYLASDLVTCVGGTWIARAEDLINERWDLIRQRAADAVARARDAAASRR